MWVTGSAEAEQGESKSCFRRLLASALTSVRPLLPREIRSEQCHPVQLSQWRSGNKGCDGLAQSLECSKSSGNNAFYRHHYLRGAANSWHHQKQSGPCLPGPGRSKLGEEVGVMVRRGCSPNTAACPGGCAGMDVSGKEAMLSCPTSPTDRWRGRTGRVGPAWLRMWERANGL